MNIDQLSLQDAFHRALAHHRSGRLAEAEEICRKILAVAPDHPIVLHFLGVLAIQSKRYDAAIDWLRRATSIMPDDIEARINLAFALSAVGRSAEAVENYRQVIALAPTHADAHYNMAVALHALDRFEEAISSYREAIIQRPDFAEAHSNLGTMLQQCGYIDEAVASFQTAILSAPANANAHFNLANAFKEQGRLDDAIAGYQRALAINPDFAAALDNLGVARHERGELDDAIHLYRRALALKPGWAETLGNLATALHEKGFNDEALVHFQQALAIRETAEIKIGFVQCVSSGDFSAEFGGETRGIRTQLVRALSEPWARPADLTAISNSLVRQNPDIAAAMDRVTAAWPEKLAHNTLFGESGFAAVANDELLRTLLENAPVNGLVLERFLTMARAVMLDAAIATEPISTVDGAEAATAFYCALARQCFNNEYVFACSDDELAKVDSLRVALAVTIEAKLPIPAVHLAAVSAYFSLADVPGIDLLFDRHWPDSVSALLNQQVHEAQLEKNYRAGIRALTTIDGEVSRRVRDQYEANPYPRWVKCAPGGVRMSFDSRLRRLFPYTPFIPLGETRAIEILVAGCGTGQHSIETAQQYPEARVLAIDLSLASLGYAIRKTRELELDNIDYAQADIMRIESIGKTFDVIESVGVLHHLEHPLAGWRNLLALLRPGGFMRLGLYSEAARAVVVAARQFIADTGYAANASGIRRCRQALIDAEGGKQFAQLLSFRDFFGTSECRDLLFHVQEHRYTLPELSDCLAALGVEFLGFSLDPAITALYRARFPDDRSMNDLARWHIFETENPQTFAGMYQFWIQKNA